MLSFRLILVAFLLHSASAHALELQSEFDYDHSSVPYSSTSATSPSEQYDVTSMGVGLRARVRTPFYARGDRAFEGVAGVYSRFASLSLNSPFDGGEYRNRIAWGLEAGLDWFGWARTLLVILPSYSFEALVQRSAAEPKEHDRKSYTLRSYGARIEVPAWKLHDTDGHTRVEWGLSLTGLLTQTLSRTQTPDNYTPSDLSPYNVKKENQLEKRGYRYSIGTFVNVRF